MPILTLSPAVIFAANSCEEYVVPVPASYTLSVVLYLYVVPLIVISAFDLLTVF